MTRISERIKEGLKLRNMKQIDLIKSTGINKGALSSYISGRYKPKQNNLHLIAKALDVSEAWLMGLEEIDTSVLEDEDMLNDTSDINCPDDNAGDVNKVIDRLIIHEAEWIEDLIEDCEFDAMLRATNAIAELITAKALLNNEKKHK